MIRTLGKAWWLLVLCGAFDAMNAALNLLMLNLDGNVILRRFALPNTVWDMGLVAVGAGVLAVAAGIWSSGRANSWLSVHGLALGAYGAIAVSPIVKGPLSFRPVSLLFVLMCLSIGAFALLNAQSLRRSTAKWVLAAAGVASIGFAFSFVAVGFGWVRLGAPYGFWIWMSSYFAFCALFMLWLGVYAHATGVSESGPGELLTPLGNPRHAH